MKRATALIMALCIGSGFQAEAVGVNSNGQNGVIRTLSATTLGATTLNLGGGINVYQSGTYVDDVFDPDGEQITMDHPNREAARMLSTNLFCGTGLTRFLDLAVSLPFYYDWLGFDNLQDGGIGDMEISSKFLYPSPSKRLFFQSYYAAITIPTGMQNNGFFPRHPYYIEGKDTNQAPTFYSAKYPTFKGLMLWTFDIGNVAPKVPLQFHLNLGGVITTTMNNQRNTAIGSFAAVYSPIETFSLFIDIHGESRWSNFATSLDPSSDPWLLSPGIRITTPSGVYVNFVGDLSLSSRAESARLSWNPRTGSAKDYRYSTGVFPPFGIQFMLGWKGYIKTPDDDKDGVVNSEDRCSSKPEDLDGFEDDDGCPDFDNDRDGIPDTLDKCLNDPEDKDGFEDTDGCPDLDNDRDGIPDLRDKCPDQGEDFDGFEDNDGCPDIDNDSDGIPDSLDRCPNDPEDQDGFENDDGCPDIDNDQDGVPDAKDQCPDKPGTPANNGCQPDTVKPPVKKVIDFPKSQILFGIDFRKGTAELSYESYRFIDPLVQKLAAYPELEIEIHGHTDAAGNYAANMQISQLRAESVRQYIVAKGISPTRIRAVGFGSSNPIDDNKTASGRARNRRIEVLRVK